MINTIKNVDCMHMSMCMCVEKNPIKNENAENLKFTFYLPANSWQGFIFIS